MQLARTSGFFAKTNRVITAGVRSTSCDRGWLQLFTHIVCGTFTVTSFLLILVLTLRSSKVQPGIEESRCHLAGCRVMCYEAPYYEQHDDDIVLTVMAAQANCENVFLTLRHPFFTNGSLPQNWLPRLRPVVVELGIIGGNLHHIPQNVFSAAFARNVKLLFLERITLTSWNHNTLIGLANLENIFIKECEIIDMQANILSAVSQTLETMTVVQSGYWNPGNLTGVSQFSTLAMLTTVDLSNNNFDAVLGNRSFTRLHFCKSLYLGNNRITFIGQGAFDNLVNLKYLNLNDNLLKHLSTGVFSAITSHNPPRVRLNLIDNLWHCDCSDINLRDLIQRGFFLVDPICNSPRNMRGKTFKEYNSYCKSKEPKQIITVDMRHRAVNADEAEETIMNSHICVSRSDLNFTSTVVSPFRDYPCSVDVLNSSISHRFSMGVDFYNTAHLLWIKPVISVKGENFTMIELGLSAVEGYGLIWFRNSCRNEIFCINVVPHTIRLYNLDFNNEYTFCPVLLTSGAVESTQCIAYASQSQKSYSRSRLILYPLIAVGCLFFGALSLYMLIRKYPHLLRGSKRLLFVKHKTVDALVLPPKLPLRGMHSNSSLENSRNLFTMPESRHDFMRLGSIKSSHSSAASYISALQPTEEQLADWRFKHETDKCDCYYTTISTISSSNIPISLSSGSDHLYFSLEDHSPTISIMNPLSQNSEINL